MKKIVVILLMALALIAASSVAVAAKPNKPDKASAPEASQEWQSPVLGIVVASLNKARAELMGLERDTGVVIIRVLPGSPGASAGLKVRDIITAIGGTPVATLGDLKKALSGASAEVSLSILRGNQTLTIAVVPKPVAEWRQVTPPAWLPEIEGLKASEMFDHRLGGQWAFLDKNGQRHTVISTPGIVKEVKDNTLTIVPNGQTAPINFTVTDKTQIRVAHGQLSSLQPGDKIVVIAVDNPQIARLILSGARMGKGWLGMGPMGGRPGKGRLPMRGFGMRGPHRGMGPGV